MSNLFLGIDCATQGMRAVLIDETGAIHSTLSHDLAPVIRGADGRLTQDADSWVVAARDLLSRSRAAAGSRTIAAMAISATSGTFVLTDRAGNPVAPAAMYNDARASNPLARAAAIINEIGAGSYLFAHTPEFVVAALSGQPLSQVATDWSHALKTGVDLSAARWSEGAEKTAEQLQIQLPTLVAPGTLLGKSVDGGIPIYAAMTDGCTAHISVGASAVGSAVTTLGTTLVLKIISARDIAGPGFYSHLIPQSRWLTGGASNLGGISFTQYREQIAEWDQRAAAHGPATCVAYPLVGKGERFPIASPDIAAMYSQEPQNEIDAYRATLEGIAFAERLAYETLAEAGAALSGQLYSVGGGSRSALWNSIRATVMQRSIQIVRNSGSDIGAAMIAAAASHGGELAALLDRFNSSTESEVLPTSGEIEMYEDKYQRFLALVAPFQKREIR